MGEMMPGAVLYTPPEYCTECLAQLAHIPGPLMQKYCPHKSCPRFGLMTVVYDEEQASGELLPKLPAAPSS